MINKYKKHPSSLVLFILVWIAAIITVTTIIFILGDIIIKGIPNLTMDLFAWKYTSKNVSMTPAIINTLIITALTLIIAAPIGIFSAVYLIEYAKRGSKVVKVIRITTETLQGIPSIVYGLFGFLVFVIKLEWGYSILAGAFTLAIMILPLIMRTTEEALLSVPDTYREGSLGLGAGKLRTVFKVVFPSAVPGIVSGLILAIGRIVGETAALIFTAGTVASIPNSVFSSARTLAVHIYALLSEGLFTEQANAVSLVLLVVVIGINLLSYKIANRLNAYSEKG